MKPEFAVIDIGSNSVRLMLGAMENGRAVSLGKTLCTTRLAHGLDETHRLQPDRMADSLNAIADFYQRAHSYGVPAFIYATSAVRDAENRDAFLAKIKERTGRDTMVLSGEEEGRFAYLAATGGNGTVFDIGGGSLQVVTPDSALSFPCGCVRAKDYYDASDPAAMQKELFAWLDAHTAIPETVPKPVYGVGGTISTIGALLAGLTAYDGSRLVPITLTELDKLIRLLAAIPLEQRLKMPLLKRRGDVILQGATILRYLMGRTHTDSVRPSDRDGMEGLAEHLLVRNG